MHFPSELEPILGPPFLPSETVEIIRTISFSFPDPSELPDRNRPLLPEEPTVVVTVVPTLTIEETPNPAVASPATHKSQIGTAALVGILVSLGVVIVGVLFAVIWIKRKRDQQRGRSRGMGGGEEKPPSYEDAVYGTDSDSDRWSQYRESPEVPILQSPPPTHQGIIAPRPISTNSIISLRRLDTITTSFPAQPQPQPQPQPRQPEIIVFPHDSPVLAPENDDALSLRTALRMSQGNRVLSSQSRASGRFTENFDDDNDAASVVSDLSEDERIVATEIV